MSIDPRAIVGKDVEIGEDVEIGPFAILEGPVRIGKRTRIYPGAFISGWVEVGEECEIHPHVVLGHVPQDFHFEPGTRSYLRIGDRTVIREMAQIHRGTQAESSTIVGRDCLIQSAAHIGHNCELGDGVKVYTNSVLAGHVEIGSYAIVSGLCALHQFIRIGPYVMIGGGTRVIQDVPPYMAAVYGRGCYGINTIGMRRAGRTREAIRACRDAYRLLYRSGRNFREAAESLALRADCDEVREIAAFCLAPSKRGFTGMTDKSSRNVDRDTEQAPTLDESGAEANY